MDIKKILISQPRPATEKSPYLDVERRCKVEMTFKPFIRVERLSVKDFKAQKINIGEYTGIVFTSRTAINHFFSLCNELKVVIKEDWQYYCLTETVALYLQKFVNYKKRKVHFSKTGQLDDLALVMKKHNTERILMPVADVHKEDLSIFTKAKVMLTTTIMYRTVSAEFTPEEIKSYDLLAFFTPAGINSLFTNSPEYKQGEQKIAVFGPATAKAAEDRGLRIDCKAPSQEFPSMASAIENFLEKEKAANE